MRPPLNVCSLCAFPGRRRDRDGSAFVPPPQRNDDAPTIWRGLLSEVGVSILGVYSPVAVAAIQVVHGPQGLLDLLQVHAVKLPGEVHNGGAS